MTWMTRAQPGDVFDVLPLGLRLSRWLPECFDSLKRHHFCSLCRCHIFRGFPNRRSCPICDLTACCICGLDSNLIEYWKPAGWKNFCVRIGTQNGCPFCRFKTSPPWLVKEFGGSQSYAPGAKLGGNLECLEAWPTICAHLLFSSAYSFLSGFGRKSTVNLCRASRCLAAFVPVGNVSVLVFHTNFFHFVFFIWFRSQYY